MQHKEKVLVTGANGLLGSNVADQLSKQGYDVVAVVRKNSNVLALNGIKCKIVECDITKRLEVEKAIAGSD
jgi:dihydroflavonol-4-reductase